MSAVDEIVRRLGMQPHPEGGYFVETWRSDELIAGAALPDRYGDARSIGTSIYYLLTPEGFSALHRLRSDEVWHHYDGAAVELLLLEAAGQGRRLRLGADMQAEERPQVFVKRGVWQGARVADGGAYALVGCTVVPGFAFEDFELGDAETLRRGWPAFADDIARLTR